MTKETYHTPEDIAARISGATAEHVRAWCRRGVMRHVRPRRSERATKGQILIPESAFAEWLAGASAKPPEPIAPRRRRRPSQALPQLEHL